MLIHLVPVPLWRKESTEPKQCVGACWLIPCWSKSLQRWKNLYSWRFPKFSCTRPWASQSNSEANHSLSGRLDWMNSRGPFQPKSSQSRLGEAAEILEIPGRTEETFYLVVWEETERRKEKPKPKPNNHQQQQKNPTATNLQSSCKLFNCYGI